MFRSFIFWFLPFLLAACGRPAPQTPSTAHPAEQAPISAPAKDAEAVKPPPPEVPAALHATVDASPEPFKYKVALRWPGATASAEHWRVERAETTKKTLSLVGVFAESERAFIDDKIESGAHYEYRLWADRNGEAFLHSAVQVAIPKDVVISGTRALGELGAVGRLFLMKGAYVYPAAEGQQIDVDRLIADEATLASFPAGAKAAPGAAGRSGAKLVVRAKSATGKLSIVTGGEGGGDGKPGVTGSPGRDGRKGASGLARPLQKDHGYFMLPPIVGQYQSHDHFLKLVAEAEKHYPAGHRAWHAVFSCAEAPANGTDGAKGGAGGAGQPGAKGGDGSPVLVDIAQAEDFHIEVQQAPGAGGRGGTGGAGGAGGRGGDPGDRDRYHVCGEARRGSDGTAGPRGGDGADGETGKRGPVCLRLSGGSFGDCNAPEILL